MTAADLLFVAGAYLVGSVPFGLVVARVRRGVDLRQVGSGNIGATNVLRAAGKTAAALTLVGDIGKGALAVGAGHLAGGGPGLLAALGLAVVLGHLFPVFAGFRGGKGVATALGVILATMPAVAGLLLLVWLAVALRWRYSSLAALVATAAMPPLAWALDGRPAMLALAAALAVLVFWRHRGNLRRLREGTEGKIGEQVRPAQPGS